MNSTGHIRGQRQALCKGSSCNGPLAPSLRPVHPARCVCHPLLSLHVCEIYRVHAAATEVIYAGTNGSILYSQQQPCNQAKQASARKHPQHRLSGAAAATGGVR
eukprot:GHUV01051084.1.p2 GENE.GHUV01051084.1~~GHUV01051084.1.p2  ORF type:complete len:104 (-),score=20.09 GHUV01051084.1:223-534(-)